MAPPTSPAELAVVRLAREMTSWNSIELAVRSESQMLHEGQSRTIINEDKYVETRSGKRMGDFSSRALEDGATSHKASYCDGAKCANVTYRGDVQDNIAIGRSFLNEGMIGSTDRPRPLQYFYVGKVPLYEALPGATYLGGGTVAGRESEVFLFPRVKWARFPQDLVYDLDKATSIPIRVRAYSVEGGMTDPDATAPAWSWTARTVDAIQGYHMSLRSESARFLKDGADYTSDTQSRAEITVESLVYDKSYPSSTFWPVSQPGVDIFDAIAKKSFRIPAPKPTAEESAQVQALLTDPIGAVPPSDWTEWLSPAAFGLGIAVLGVAVISWWRRR